MNDLVALGGFTIPDYVKKQEVKNNDFGVAGGFPTISMLQDKSGFMMRKDGEEVRLPRPLPVVILGVSPAGRTMSRSYYAKTFVPGTTDPPDCASTDGVAPDSGDFRQNTDCATCPMAAFGSSLTGKGQACSQYKILYLAPANTPGGDVFQHRVAVTSLKNVAQYGKTLSNHEVDKSTVITLMDYAETPPDKTYPVLQLTVGGFLEEEIGLKCIERSNSVEITSMLVGEPTQQITAPPAKPADYKVTNQQPAPPKIEAPPVYAPTPPPAPTAPEPVPPPTNSKGVIWSADHHASTQTKKADGSWKAKPGGDKDALAAYEASFQTAPELAPAASSPEPAPAKTNSLDDILKQWG